MITDHTLPSGRTAVEEALFAPNPLCRVVSAKSHPLAVVKRARSCSLSQAITDQSMALLTYGIADLWSGHLKIGVRLPLSCPVETRNRSVASLDGLGLCGRIANRIAAFLSCASQCSIVPLGMSISAILDAGTPRRLGQSFQRTLTADLPPLAEFILSGTFFGRVHEQARLGLRCNPTALYSLDDTQP